MSGKETRAVEDEIEKLETLRLRAVKSLSAADKAAAEWRTQACRTQRALADENGSNRNPAVATAPHDGELDASRDIDGFISWIAATFQVKNVGGLRTLAAAFVDKQLAPYDIFVAAAENVTIFSMPLNASSIDLLFPDKATVSPQKPPTLQAAGGKKGTNAKLPPPSPAQPKRQPKRGTSITAGESIVPATPSPPPPSKKAKTTVDAPHPPISSSTPRTTTTQSSKKAPRDHKRKPSAHPTALTDESKKDAPTVPESGRRRPAREAATLSNFLRRDQDDRLRVLNIEGIDQKPDAPLEVLDDEDDEAEAPAATTDETPPAVDEGRRRPSERNAAKFSNYIRREQDNRLRLLNVDETPSPKPPKQVSPSLPTPDALQAAYDTAIQAKPWLKWSQYFHSFLPADTIRRRAWSASLSHFFERRAFTMWHQFFLLNPSKAHAEQLTEATQECFKLVYRLHKLEGDAVFKFLLRTPHPAWPTFLAAPISLAALPTADAVAYLTAEATSRFPRSPTPWLYEPMQLLHNMANTSASVLKILGIPVHWAAELVARLQADRAYTFDECPYIGVTMFGEDAPTHVVEEDYATPASRFAWDWDRKDVVSRVGRM
ncbi:hypothetical protein DYB25_009205 [Aphanomyces astaci]|uniref:Uncharacterized protein n=1 Tax=Aphanomyces astaci TaxID=112090 RepID=A0A397C762_APHAT|nr:hypothetical protein DYB25_009205 [Aphanomyces astaci]RHY42173.1 hypothetical protein DYB34_002863 [Aphanomyces astaci]RHY60140.1 hypothetical protein DYB38_004887 [Aphanomyces astaci]